MANPTLRELAQMIDHSLLHPTLTEADTIKGLDLARQYQVATACVKPYATRLAKDRLAGSGVGVCAVIGFPHGNSSRAIKVAETREVIGQGATEVDMVINIGDALGGLYERVQAEVQAVNEACVSQGAILKVIFETDYLKDEHIVRLCQVCTAARVAFVKTSTGYGFTKQPSGDYNYQGATDHVLQLMRANCPPTVQVKAAGGVRTLDDLLRVRALGVTRIGATATQGILEEAKRRGMR